MTTCHFAGKQEPRMRGPKHDGPHTDCEECTARHCVVCGVEHVIQPTCPKCIAAVRSDLILIPQLVAELAEQALEGSGSVGHLLAAEPIPGGDATVLRAGGSDGRNQSYEIVHGIVRRGESRSAPWADDEAKGDPEPPLLVLASWEDDWRLAFGHRGGPKATVQNAAWYLRDHLSRAAQEHPAFDEFAEHVRRVRARLEDATGHGTGDQGGAACVHCKATLTRKAEKRKHRGMDCPGHGALADVCPLPRGHGCRDRGGVDLDGDWECPRCHRRYDKQAYDNAVRATFLTNAPALTDRDMHSVYGVAPGTVRRWASEGRVHKRGRADDGRTLYDVGEVKEILAAQRIVLGESA